MADKNHLLNHRTEKYTKKLKVPPANVIDLRKVEAEREEARRLLGAHKPIEKVVRGLRWSSFRSFLKSVKLPKKPKEKVIISQSKVSAKEGKGAAKAAPTPPPPVQEKLDLNHFQLTAGWSKKLIVFVAICCLIILPVYSLVVYQRVSEAKGKVLGASAEGYRNLQAAGTLASASAFASARQSFSQAVENFTQARGQLEEAGGLILAVGTLLPGEAKSGQYLLDAAAKVSQAGVGLTSVVSGLEVFQVNPLSGNSSSLTDFLALMRGNLLPVRQNLDVALNLLEKVEVDDVPEGYRDRLAEIKGLVPALQRNIHDFFSLADVLLNVLGHETPKRYLFVFQNSRELRPTGGFIGSIALVDIYKGKIENLEVPGGGVYDVAGQLNERIIAPKPLWLVNPHWNIQDANWFPDFPTSASKLMWFFERTGGATVDGIIALTPRVIEDLLALTGPIDMQDSYGVVVDASNFVRQAQVWAEVEYDREENQPKKFIGDLLPLLLERVFEIKLDNLFATVGTFSHSLVSRDLLLYFSDGQLEQNIKSLGWDGSVASSGEGDYLFVVNTNIAGGKTDHVIDQLVGHSAGIQADGSIIDTVTLTRAHRGNPLDQWEGTTNVSYVRFYVPEGSKLISVSGFTPVPSFRYQLPDEDAVTDDFLTAIEGDSIVEESTETRLTTEFGKTVFGNWLTTEPGEVKQVKITYTLPFKINTSRFFGRPDTYSLFVQKQPGIVNNYFVGTVVVPAGFELLWHSPGVQVTDGNARYISDLDGDKYYGVLLNR